MSKKLFYILLIIASILGIGCLTTGIILLVNNKTTDDEQLIAQKLDLNVKKIETEETVNLVLTFEQIEGYAEENVSIYYIENDEQKEQGIYYDSEIKGFVFLFYKKENECSYKKIGFKINGDLYEYGDLTVAKKTEFPKYYWVGLEVDLAYDSCYAKVNTNYENIFEGDIYFNDKFLERITLQDGISYVINYNEEWLDKNKIEIKNVTLEDDNAYTDEIILKEFSISNQFELLYLTTNVEKLYYLDDSVEVTLAVKGLYNFLVASIVINDEEFKTFESEILKGSEKIKIIVPKEKLKITENKYELKLNEIKFTKGNLKLNEKVLMDKKDEKITANISLDKECYWMDEKQKMTYKITNPYGLKVTGIVINNEVYEVNSNSTEIYGKLDFNNETKFNVTKVIYEYNKEIYEEKCEQEIEIKVYDAPQEFRLENEHVFVENYDKKITLIFDKNFKDFDVSVYYEKVNELQEKVLEKYPVEVKENDKVNIILTDLIENIGLHNIVISKIVFSNDYLTKEIIVKENEKNYTVVYYKDVKEITFGPLDTSTGVVELFEVECDNGVLLKTLTLEIYDLNGNLIEQKEVKVVLDAETQKYKISTNRFESFSAKITSVGYEKDGLTYYTKLPYDQIQNIM